MTLVDAIALNSSATAIRLKWDCRGRPSLVIGGRPTSRYAFRRHQLSPASTYRRATRTFLEIVRLMAFAVLRLCPWRRPPQLDRLNRPKSHNGNVSPDTFFYTLATEPTSPLTFDQISIGVFA